MDGVRSVFPARGRIYRYTCGLASESGSGIAPGRHSDLASRDLSPGNRCPENRLFTVPPGQKIHTAFPIWQTSGT